MIALITFALSVSLHKWSTEKTTVNVDNIQLIRKRAENDMLKVS